MRRMPTAILAVVLALPAMAQESVTIKVRPYPPVKKKTTYTNITKDTGSIKLTGDDGKEVAEIKPGGSETVRHDTVLAADASGEPTKFLRIYEKATETRDGETKTYSYEGLTLLYEKGKDDKFKIGIVGKGKIEPKDAERLYEKQNKPSESEAVLKQLRMKGPVKVGETFTLDLKPVAEAMEAEIDEEKSSITMKLTRVVKRGESQFGIFDFDQRMFVKVWEGPLQSKFDPPAEYRMNGTLELAIDGSTPAHTAKLAASLKGTGTWPQGKITFNVSGDVSARQSPASDAPTAIPSKTINWLPAPGDWIAFRPKDASFDVTFPAVPKESAKKDARGNNTIQWSASTEEGAVAFIVAATDFVGAADKVDPKEILDGVAKSQKNPMNLKDIKQDGYPGIEFQRDEASKGNRLIIHHRVVMAGGRMYQQIVVAEKSKLKPADVEKFMKSFTIAKPKKRD